MAKTTKKTTKTVKASEAPDTVQQALEKELLELRAYKAENQETIKATSEENWTLRNKIYLIVEELQKLVKDFEGASVWWMWIFANFRTVAKTVRNIINIIKEIDADPNLDFFPLSKPNKA